MSWNFIISFAVAVGLYLVVVLIIGFIKRHKKNKQKDNSEVHNEEEVNK